ncbi:PIN domain-containing protein [Lacihabitans sp. CS3-21]|uniref:type II toxin-antitoxin system VapC family toxin n=1 Tax=Lacihabitans sp. CS3-21 TaxID=2487332 RepID=UPI0020CF1658|nr:PIN domain-containing protein [Lacihabitans sp. CS3-21]MCP9748449.1 PIN domain-containing protein [Lacihabitans sp. CS3-21]
MKNIFLDTNIIVDLIADRPPFSKYAIELFSLAEDNKIKLYTSSHSLATTHYLLKKYIEEKELRVILHNLLEFITIIPVDLDVLRKSLHSKHKDFEDAVQIYCASSINGMEYIVTRNIKDFKNSEIPALLPNEIKAKL